MQKNKKTGDGVGREKEVQNENTKSDRIGKDRKQRNWMHGRKKIKKRGRRRKKDDNK
jgi:hypothetical protein